MPVKTGTPNRLLPLQVGDLTVAWFHPLFGLQSLIFFARIFLLGSWAWQLGSSDNLDSSYQFIGCNAARTSRDSCLRSPMMMAIYLTVSWNQFRSLKGLQRFPNVSLLTTAHHVMTHSTWNSSLPSGEHYWLCSEPQMTEGKLRRFLWEAMNLLPESNFSDCRRRGSNHQPLDNKVVALSIPPWGLL